MRSEATKSNQTAEGGIQHPHELSRCGRKLKIPDGCKEEVTSDNLLIVHQIIIYNR